MPISTCVCLCNGSTTLVRNFLRDNGYPDWLAITVPQGKDKSLSLVKTLPNFPEKQELTQFLQNSSKWALIIGYNENGMRWADISRYNIDSRTNAKHIIETFS